MIEELLRVFLYLLALAIVACGLGGLYMVGRVAAGRDRKRARRYTDLQRGSQEPYDHEREGL